MRSEGGSDGQSEGRENAPFSGQLNYGHQVFAVRDGDQHISVHQDGPPFELQPFPHEDKVDAGKMRGQPSRLLLARNQVVRFAGRREELLRLQHWLHSPERLSVLLVHGPGGTGKTRLADEFASIIRARNWSVLSATQGRTRTTPVVLEATRGVGKLIIVDYAERWRRTGLLALLSDAGITGPGMCRVLLLARTATSWWGDLRSPLTKLDAVVDTMRLEPLAADTGQRQQLFHAARDSFARIYEIDPAGAVPAGRISDPHYESVLKIHMSALAAVDALARHRRPPTDPGHLSEYLLDRERDHWAAMSENGRIESSSSRMTRTTFLATVCGPVHRAEGVRLVRASGLAPDDFTARQVLDDHRACYPPADDGTVLEPLAPDWLGEDFVARGLAAGSADPFSDYWLPDMAGQALASAEFAVHRRRVVSAMAETAKRWAHVRRYLNERLREISGELLSLGGQTLLAVAEVADLDLLAALEPQLPEKDVEFDSVAARIAQRLTRHRLKTAVSPAEQARLRTALGRRLGNASLFQAALDESATAVQLLQELAAGQPRRYEEPLAEALHYHGSHLAGLGRRRAAQEATEQAVLLRRRLCARHPLRYEALLTDSLDNLAIDLSAMGETRKALSAACEAVNLHRGVEQRTGSHQPRLAASLHNLGKLFGQSTMLAEATAALREAGQLYEQLRAAEPSKYEAELAAVRNDSAFCALDQGAPGRGAEEATSAMQANWVLAGRYPAGFESELVTSLLGLANNLSHLGYREYAQRTSGHAVSLSGRLAEEHHDRYDVRHAASMHSHAINLARSGRPDQALAAAERAVELRSILTDKALTRHELELYATLRTAGVVLRTGRTDEDSPAAEAPVSVRRRLQLAVDAIFTENAPGISDATENLWIRLFRAHRLATAITGLTPEMAPNLRETTFALAERQAELARSLASLSSRLSDVNRHGEALTNAQRGSELFARLAASDPDKHSRELASSLAALGLRLADVGRQAEALDATRSALKQLDARDPAVFKAPQTATVLQAFGWVRKVAGLEQDDALRAVRLAAGIYRDLGATRTGVYVNELRSVMALEAGLLAKLGRLVDSLEVRSAAGLLPAGPSELRH
ncbi:AAA family ATPase [Amycolatopsis sp. NPDC004772]